MLLFLIWATAIFFALVLYFKQIYSRFTRHGVKTPRTFPIVGNAGFMVLGLESYAENIYRLFNSFPEERFIGTFQFTRPLVLVRDLELLKKMTIRDFEHFIDHRPITDKEIDPIFARNLFSLEGQEWKDMRSTLSPAFTSSKIRLMVPFMVDAAEQMVKAMKKQIKNSGATYIDMQAKELAVRYGVDVIASCAFGVKVDSHVDQDNEFYKIARYFSGLNFKEMIKFLFFLAFPRILKKLRITFAHEQSNVFFRKLMLTSMKDRETHHIYRPDLIQILMEVKKGDLRHDKTKADEDAGFATVEESDVGKSEINRKWSDDDLVAQANVFFLAGFDTMSTMLSFALYEIAVNPGVQEKLVREIRENNAENNGKFDYKSVQRMTYMDMVVSEVLRLWPPGVASDRLCVKDYNMGRPNDKATEDFIIRKGEAIAIPIWAYHRNPDYFPNPEKFDPERFSEENRKKIKPFSYMPFGIGPRNCIGSRFALCDIKVMIYQLFLHMELSPCEKTIIPVQLGNSFLALRAKGGHCLRFKIRE